MTHLDPAATAEHFKIRLPATTANLGPGFDAVALAMTLYLEVEAGAAAEFSIDASGRNADICGSLENNLLIQTYCDVLRDRAPVIPLALTVQNGIPLGMGCGSSAAVILAGIALANHFGSLGWSGDQVLAEACEREGHPDNAAACWLGGFTAAAMEEGRVHAVRLATAPAWKLMLVLPSKSLATKTARGLLPDSYSRRDTVFNVQRVALLTAAFAESRADLLHVAMRDHIHQPYRMEVCPLLERLLPLADGAASSPAYPRSVGIAGVALSGAGPAVLLVLEEGASTKDARDSVSGLVGSTEDVEIIVCEIESGTGFERHI